ncbi:PREDICTED: uncharacterized protein LOC109465928 [Branchiostoma belcheri]|uniref:Uncharacterized protein LOC109465928 n=1 Tax=Branchiostoma belcheri TaxID=7741 RepID=A0A6P4YJV8_BRABE|nr:PREDICTED: uncharacterized protein LOC109465928 [Branchiostoma belcheri]
MMMSKEEIGEQLLEKVRRLCPTQSNKVTGMLLELPTDTLLELLREEGQLQAAVGKAQVTLQEGEARETERVHCQDQVPVVDRCVVLREHLYAAVCTVNSDNADRITEELLEQEETGVFRLLQDRQLLETAVQEALHRIEGQSSRSGTGSSQCVDKEDVGNILYEKVEELQPDMCAKITGMLLELPEDTLQTLLADKQALQSAVHRAVKAVQGGEQHGAVHELQLDSDKQEIGEQLFDIVCERYEEDAPKITGMLLEMETTTLRRLLESPEELNEKINQAYNALCKS